jgi:flagellar export protein FliJ
MIKRVKRVEAAIDVVARSEQELARELAQARRQLEMEQSKYQRLRGYMEDYRHRQIGRTGPIKPALLRENLGFQKRLGEAVSQQRQQVEMVKARIDALVASWRESRTRVSALERAVGRMREDLSRKEARREQAATDEAGSRGPRRGPR